MSITLKLQQNPDDCVAPEVKLQYIPARVHTNIEEATNIQQLFSSYTKPKKDHQLSGNPIVNSLRGYPIIGDDLHLPATHVGMVFKEDKKPLSEDAPRVFRQTCQFDKFVLWNYDQTPSANDTVLKAIDSFGLVDELHKPVDPNEFEEFVKKQQKPETEPNENASTTTKTE